MTSYTETILETYSQQARDLSDYYATAPNQGERERHGDYLPPRGAEVLDLGAGGGATSLRYLGLGYQVTAVEPSSGMREVGKETAPQATWIDDRLPTLDVTRGMNKQWSFILCKSVFMHVEPKDRKDALINVFHLLTPGGILALLFRHGPAPDDRPMFEATPTELDALALDVGFKAVETKVGNKDPLGREGVHFSWHWWQRPKSST